MDYYISIDKLNTLRDVQMIIYNMKEVIRTSPCPIYRLKLEDEVIRHIEYFLNQMEGLTQDMEVNYMGRMNRQAKEFTIDELSTFDGSYGRPAYVAVNGIVYDISLEATWGGASHFGLKAGKDLTTQFNTCHGKLPILSKLSVVGILKYGGVE